MGKVFSPAKMFHDILTRRSVPPTRVTTVREMAQLARASSIPDALRAHNLDLPLAGRILEESQRRMLALPPELRRTPAHLIGVTPNPKAAEGTPERELAAFFYGRQAALEMGNRLPGGSVKLLGATDYFFMVDPGIPGIAKVLAESPGQLLHMAQEGAELLSKNQAIPGLGTAVRGLPTGGASSRARSWVAENREFAGKMGIDEGYPSFSLSGGNLRPYPHASGINA